MKKLLRFADCFVLLAAIIGCLLRLWLQNTGVDQKGLYRTDHPAWILLCVVSVAIVAFLWFATRQAGDDRRYSENFPRSTTGGVTHILMALVLTYVGITELLDATGTLDQLTAMTCLLSAVMLGATALERFGGHQPAMFLHLIPCIFFALRLFQTGRNLGTEPEVCTFLFGFLAAIGMVLAFYYLWAFDMNMGNRRKSLFWSLTAAYFCLVTTFESADLWVQYMVFAAFLLSNLCQLKYLPASETTPKAEQAETAPVEEAVAPPAEETEQGQMPETAEEAAEIPAEESAEEMLNTETAEDVPADMPEDISVETEEAVAEEMVEQAPAASAEVEAPAPEEKENREEPFAMPPLCTPKESRETAFLKETENMQKRVNLRTDIDPDEDLDAFLEDIKLFLANEE